jgi:hypothetical protein
MLIPRSKVKSHHFLSMIFAHVLSCTMALERVLSTAQCQIESQVSFLIAGREWTSVPTPLLMEPKLPMVATSVGLHRVSTLTQVSHKTRGQPPQSQRQETHFDSTWPAEGPLGTFPLSVIRWGEVRVLQLLWIGGGCIVGLECRADSDGGGSELLSARSGELALAFTFVRSWVLLQHAQIQRIGWFQTSRQVLIWQLPPALRTQTGILIWPTQIVPQTPLPPVSWRIKTETARSSEMCFAQLQSLPHLLPF